ncbi:MAG: prolyl-tRNA synthetase associated domain-containing protein [Candidatus Peribacteria bacterium]|nr:MAG: prolyl-tRNA synthetase associated domain-containing protein [Candidatus Peribacteria bacterium]
MQDIYHYLDSHHITYSRYDHPAVYTCEEAELHCSDVPGIACKNLFFRAGKGQRYYLVIAPAQLKTDIKHITSLLGEKKLSFASAETLMEKLGLEPGSVSPFGLINDSEHTVLVAIATPVLQSDLVSFHPNTNTATLVLTQEIFQQFLQSVENEVVELPL